MLQDAPPGGWAGADAFVLPTDLARPDDDRPRSLEVPGRTVKHARKVPLLLSWIRGCQITES
jgi:hypothetical protein